MNVLDAIQKAIDTKTDISEENKRILLSIMQKNPTFFEKMQNNVIEIMKDNKIDIFDLPQLILCISELFNMHLKIPNIDLFNILQFIIFAIIEKLPFNNNGERELAIKMAQNSLSLLKQQLVFINTKVPDKCCYCK